MKAHLTPTRPVDQIRIGPGHEREPGDLRALAADIDAVGLIHPVCIRPDGELIAGWRRLRAWRLSSRRDEPIPVHVVDLAAIARGKFSENTQRKDLTPSETVALMRALQPEVRAIARERQASLGRSHGIQCESDETPVAQLAPEGGRSRDLVARLVGRSARTLEKAEAVVAAAESEPERYGRLVQAMDRTGKVDGPFKRLTVMRQAERIRAEPPCLPQHGPYRVASIDAPWPFDAESEDPSERGTHPYPQMSYAQIAAMPIAGLMTDDAVLWFWTTNHHLPRAYPILEAYGFTPKTMLTWTKDQIGRGHYLREQTEHAILAVRGRPVITLTNESTHLYAPRGAHSAKPVAFYELVERVCPAPVYADIFAHGQRRPGWHAHSTETVEAAPPPRELAAAG